MYVVCTTKAWNIQAFAELRGNDPNWHLITSREALNAAFLSDLQPDWVFFPHWSWKVPPSIFKRWNCVVFHTAPLPRYRGGSVLQHQIMDGMKESEICALQMVDKIDAGPVYLRQKISLERSAQDFFDEFAYAVHDIMDILIEDGLEPEPQKGEPTVYTRRIPEESRLLGDETLENIYNKIRALDADGYPKAVIHFGGLRLEFDSATEHVDCVGANVVISKL